MFSTFKKVSEMLKGNSYTSHEVSSEGGECYRINAGDSNISIVIKCDKEADEVNIIGYVLNDIVYKETYTYDDSNCWKYNVIDFKVTCARVFCKATEEYVTHETLASLSIFETPNNCKITTKNSSI